MFINNKSVDSRHKTEDITGRNRLWQKKKWQKKT